MTSSPPLDAVALPPLEKSRWRYTLMGALRLRNEVLVPIVGAVLFFAGATFLGIKVSAPDDPVLGNAAAGALSLVAGVVALLLIRWCWHPVYLRVTPKGGVRNTLRGGLGEMLWPLLVISGVLLLLFAALVASIFWLTWMQRERTTGLTEQLRTETARITKLQTDMAACFETARIYANEHVARLNSEMSASRKAERAHVDAGLNEARSHTDALIGQLKRDTKAKVLDDLVRILQPLDYVLNLPGPFPGGMPSQIAAWMTRDETFDGTTYATKLAAAANDLRAAANAAEGHRVVYQNYEDVTGIVDPVIRRIRELADQATAIADAVRGIRPSDSAAIASFRRSDTFAKFKANADSFIQGWFIGQWPKLERQRNALMESRKPDPQ